ncbi:MAG: hypothetical protein J6O51_02350 [Bacteroidales bacterium]|nr:hypothetical protein [Bacteroidales bacterium]
MEYTLTERAGSVLPILDELLAWAIEHFNEILTDRQHNSSSTL